MTNDNVRRQPVAGVHTLWAPILFEPIAGSGERITIALAATNADGVHEFLRIADPETAKMYFRGQAGFVHDVVSVTLENCVAFLQSGRDFRDWEPPLQGVFVGDIQEVEASSLNDLLRLAAPMSSFLYRDPLAAGQFSPRKTNVGWGIKVREKVLQANKRFSQNFNVPVYLGNHEAPAVFTFLNHCFAANLTTLRHNNLKRRLEDARAKLWALNLLADAPSYLFKPETRELLTGVDTPEDDAKGDMIREAVEALNDEAQRRDITVVQVSSPEAAADRILSKAMAA